jgi:hypothetical protein
MHKEILSLRPTAKPKRVKLLLSVYLKIMGYLACSRAQTVNLYEKRE